MDWQQVLTWGLGILTTLFGGLNIFQWITLRSYKRVKAAEADRMEIENLQKVIESMQHEINRLRDRLDVAEKRAQDNTDKYFALQEEFEQYKLTHK